MAKRYSTPRGTRDFGPIEMGRRDYIFETIRAIFKLFGYLPIETPAMENLSTLLGKYGEEGDRLLYKILNSGDPFDKVTPEELERGDQLALKVCDRGLRYDLTVPFARFVVQHQNEITFPFKRYQIQPVWRADRPQKGRYREFYQCDVDVIGSDSLINELELVQICDRVFKALNIGVVIKLNNRKILAGIAEVIGHGDKLTEVTVAIDKIEKIGLEKVKEELEERGVEGTAIAKLEPFLILQGSTQEKIDALSAMLSTSEEGMRGVEEIKELFEMIELTTVTSTVEFDISLARGLNYYTGTIFEVKATETEIGSICGGGRYDDLTGIFGLPNLSGVGISFGADRIYDVLLALDRFPTQLSSTTQLLFANFGKNEERFVIPILEHLREEGIVAELYPEQSRLRRQFEYAEKRSIPYLAIIGAREMEEGVIAVKELESGEQIELQITQLASWLRERG